MKKSGLKNLLYLFLALVAAVMLQVLAAAAIMVPIGIIGGLQIYNQGVTDPVETEMILNTYVEAAMGPTVLVTHLVLAVAFVFWYAFGCCKERKLIKAVKNTFLPKKNILLIVVIGLGGCFLTNFAMPLASLIIPESIMQAYMDLMEAAGFGDALLPTIAAICVAPIGEELIFRGVTYHYARKLTDTMASKRAAFYLANVIQALAFGIFHGNLVQGTYAFLLGLLLGYLRERFGSILAPILAHALINFASSFLWEPVYGLLPDVPLTYVIGTLIFGGIVWLGLHLGGPALREQKETEIFKKL